MDYNLIINGLQFNFTIKSLNDYKIKDIKVKITDLTIYKKNIYITVDIGDFLDIIKIKIDTTIMPYYIKNYISSYNNYEIFLENKKITTNDDDGIIWF
jgi:hypothetical protein